MQFMHHEYSYVKRGYELPNWLRIMGKRA